MVVVSGESPLWRGPWWCCCHCATVVVLWSLVSPQWCGLLLRQCDCACVCHCVVVSTHAVAESEYAPSL